MLHNIPQVLKALGVAEVDVEHLLQITDELNHVERVDVQRIERGFLGDEVSIDIEVLDQNVFDGVNGRHDASLGSGTLVTALLEQAVAALAAAVQHAERIGVAVGVDEEVVAEQVDLDERLLLGHRLELDFLHAHDLVVGGQVGHEGIQVEVAGAFAHFADGGGVAVGACADLAVDDARLVLAQLAQHLGGGHVDGGVHVLLGFLDMHDVALRADGDLALARQGDGRVLLHAQDDFGVERVDVHDLHGVADFLLGVLTQCIGYVHFASGYGDAMSTSSVVGE